MKIRKREEKTWHAISKTQDNHISDYMGKNHWCLWFRWWFSLR